MMPEKKSGHEDNYQDILYDCFWNGQRCISIAVTFLVSAESLSSVYLV